jgi:hypothetical protein
MSNRRIALGLGTGAGALLGAALLSGLTSPLAAAGPESSTDTFTIDPVSSTLVTDPTLTAFGGYGTDTVTTEEYVLFDTTQNEVADVTGSTTEATGAPGTEEVLTNTYSTPLFTDISTDVTSATTTGVPTAGDVGSDATGSLAGNVGYETDAIYLDPSQLGEDWGITLESVPSATSGGEPTVTTDIIIDGEQYPLSDPLSSLGAGTDLSSLFSGADLSSLLGGGDLLSDALSGLLGSF